MSGPVSHCSEDVHDAAPNSVDPATNPSPSLPHSKLNEENEYRALSKPHLDAHADAKISPSPAKQRHSALNPIHTDSAVPPTPALPAPGLESKLNAKPPVRKPLTILQEREPLKRPRSDALPLSSPKKSRLDGERDTTFIVDIGRVELSPEPIYDEKGEVIDDDDRDPQMCLDYADDIYAYLYKKQMEHVVDPAYIQQMPSTHRWKVNRHTLVNWMLTVHKKFKFVAETLYLGVNLVDRFLSKKVVPLNKIQVLGATALFIAAKFEEIMTPSVSNFAFVANSTEENLREMEIDVLVTLGFDLSYANPLNFLRRISKADDYDVRTRTLGKFLLEMHLFEPKLMVYKPSDLAAAAMHLSREILGLKPWSRNFVYYSNGCTSKGLEPITQIMKDYLAEPCEERDSEYISKYMSKRNLQAAFQAVNWARS